MTGAALSLDAVEVTEKREACLFHRVGGSNATSCGEVGPSNGHRVLLHRHDAAVLTPPPGTPPSRT